jgi:hypothetical protein
MDFITSLQLSAAPLKQTGLTLLCAYLSGQAISSLYAWKRNGQDYSRSLAQSLVLGGLVGAMIMLAIGNSLARGMGIFGALALIRFRTNLRDPLDMIFIFASFAGGIACGAGNIVAGMLGTGVFALVVVTMRQASGRVGDVEADLRIRLAGDVAGAQASVLEVLRTHSTAFALRKRRALAAGKEKGEHRLAFHVILREQAMEPILTDALLLVPGVTDVSIGLDGADAQTGRRFDDD